MTLIEALSHALYSALRLAASTIAPWVVKELERLRDNGDEVETLYYSALLRSVELAEGAGTPVCQDTGTPILLVEDYGGLTRRQVEDAATRATQRAEAEGVLRPNRVHGVVEGLEPGWWSGMTLLDAATPSTDGDHFKATLLLRGGGAEYYSEATCTATHHAKREAWSIVKHAVQRADGRPCPPIIVAIGAGPSIAEAARQAYTALAGIGGWKRLTPPLNLGPGGTPLPVKPRILAVLGRAAPSHPACTCIATLIQCWALRGARIWVGRGEYGVEPL